MSIELSRPNIGSIIMNINLKLVATIIILTLLSFNIPFISISESPVSSPPPPTGTWWVNDNTRINDTNIEVNGNLTINSTGILELINVTLIMNGNITVYGDFILKNVTIFMNCTIRGPNNITNGIFGIYVEPGGLMYVLDYDNNPGTNDSSIITSSVQDGEHCYTFWVKAGSRFKIENSGVSECGYGYFFVGSRFDYSVGLLIETDNVQLMNSTFNSSKNGVIFNSSNSFDNVILNCTFSVKVNSPDTLYGYYGLTLLNVNRTLISGCKFYNLLRRSLTIYETDKNTIKDCYIEDDVAQISNLRYTMGIYILYSNNTQIINITEKKIYIGLYLFNCVNNQIKNFTIIETSLGISISFVCDNIFLENINIIDLIDPSPFATSPGIDIFSYNTNIYIKNCSIVGNESSLTDGIIWDDPSGASGFIFENVSINCSSIALGAHNFGIASSDNISNVIIRNSSFCGGLHAFASLYELDNWLFSNCSFKKSVGKTYYNFENGIISFANNLDEVVFNDCNINFSETQDDIDGVVISSYYSDVGFDLSFIDCNISGNSKNGIGMLRQDNALTGTLTLEKCTINGNLRNGILCDRGLVNFYFNNSDLSDNAVDGIQLTDIVYSYINIQNCTITNNSNAGITLFNLDESSNISISNSIIQGNRNNGLKTWYSNCYINLKKSDFIENTPNALEITDCSIYIEDCNFSKNNGSGLLLDNSDFYLYNSKISSNQNYGLNLTSCNGKIRENIIKDNFEEGIRIYDSSEDMVIEYNTFDNNAIKNGISELTMELSSAVIRYNNFLSELYNSNNIGLQLIKCSWVNIEENTFDGEFTESVIDVSSSSVQIVRNQILKSGPLAKGISGHGKSTIQIINNTLTSAGKYGIHLSSESSATITENTISGWDIGINFTDITTTLDNNTIKDSNYCGIYVTAQSDVILNDNKIINNRYGLMIDGTVGLYRNIISASSDSGIYLKAGAEANLFSNTFSENNIGMLIEDGNPKSNGNIFIANEYGIYLVDTNEGSFIDDIIMDNNIGLKAENSDFILSKYLFENNNDNIVLQSSSCKIYNSSIIDSKKDFILDDNSYCWVINSEMAEDSVAILDAISKLERQWYLNLTILDINQQPISGVRIIIEDKSGHEVYDGKSSVYGTLEMLNLTSKSWSQAGSYNPNPYSVILSKTRYGTTINELNFTGNSNFTFTAYELSDIITKVEAMDIPNDQGGMIGLSWESIPIINFNHFNIYVDSEYITSVVGLMPINSSISNQTVNSTIIKDIHGIPLENGKKYYFAITVVDSSNNENMMKVKCSNSVIPIDNISPGLVKNFTAFDTPNDNGGSITLMWEPAIEPDFYSYEIYYMFENIATDLELSSINPVNTIKDVGETSQILSGLTDKAEYYFFILVYDKNGNVNLSYELVGPVIPRDNLPPIINRILSEPSISEKLEFEANEVIIFKVYLLEGEDVVFRWYLDGILLEEGIDPYYYLSFSGLSLGDHNLTVLAVEPSELQDNFLWNFTIKEQMEEGEIDTSELVVLWTALVIILFIILIIAIFGIRHTLKFTDARKTINSIPTLGVTQAAELIYKKRERGDKYILSKLVKDLPDVLASQPDKLFLILRMLAKDDISEVRETAAKNIAKLFDIYPNKVFMWIYYLQKMGMKPEIYSIISRTSQTKDIKNLFEAYYRNLTAKNEYEYKSSLENSELVLRKFDGTRFGKEMSIIYSTLNDFYKYRTVSKISTSIPMIDRIQAFKNFTPDLLYPEAMEVFSKMGMVAESLGKYEKVEGVEDKISYLSQGISWVEEATRLARENLQPPERELFILVLDSWRNIISMSIRELRGRADLSLTLIGKEVVINQEKLTLMLEIENQGRSIAERVLVEVVPSNDYIILTPPQEIGTISQKKSKEVIFEIKPRTTEGFRVEFSIHYDDAERMEKSISFGDFVTFIAVGAAFQEIPNPYIVGTPIKTGSKLFVGRRDLIDFIQNNISGSLQENIIVLIGNRRTGKTTLLKQLPVYLDKRYIPVYVDVQGIIDPGMDAFFYLLANEIVMAMQERGIDISLPGFEEFKERPSFFFEYKFLKEVYNKLGGSILVLMFDEFEELEVKVDSGLLDKNIFSYFRHLMQHTTQLAFIFTGSSRLEDLKTDYWSIMFNIALYKRVSFLSEEETKELIIQPVKKYNMIYDSLAIEKIYRLTYGHPYFTQLLCHALVNLHNTEKKNYITIQDVNGELNRILERGQMHFDFIWDRSSMIERLVMTALKRVLQEEESVTVSSLVNKLGGYDLTIDAKNITKALDALAGKDIISKILNHTTTYEFKVDLIRIWLESTKHLDQVVEEFRSGL